MNKTLFSLFVLLLISSSSAEEVTTSPTPEPEWKTEFDWIGIIALVAFYAIVIGVGIWASRKQKADTAVELALAGTIDFFGRSRKDPNLHIIIDHKTNADLQLENKYNSFAFDPISHVPNTSFGHY